MPLLKNITPLQMRYLNDAHRFLIVSAGRRARKTLIARRKVLIRALEEEGRYFHGAPTRQQAKDIFWTKLKKNTQHIRKAEPHETELCVKLLNGSEIHVVGLDKPERIEGQPWNGCHITEFGNVKRHAWEANLRPVLADTLGWAILDGVPEAGNLNYRDMAKRACGGVIPKVEPFVGAFAENGEWAFFSWFSSDVLKKSEMDEIKSSTDPVTYRIEYEGSFEQLTGLVYYAYRPEYYPHGNLDKEIKYDENLPIYIGFDFNVSPMTAALSHFRVSSSGKNKGEVEMHFFKAYHLKNSNTEALMSRILSEYPKTHTWYVTTCQSGKARQTSADINVTDRRIIRRMFQEAGKNCIMMNRTKNPPIKWKVNSVNSMLYHRKIRVNPQDRGIKELINDWETVAWKDGSSDIDDGDPMRGHLSDCVGYLTERHFPISGVTDTSGLSNLTL